MRNSFATIVLSVVTLVSSCGGGGSTPKTEVTNANNGNNTNTEVKSSTNSQSNVDGKPSDFTITALDIGKQRQASGPDTDNKYKGKMITITDGDMSDASKLGADFWVSIDAYVGKTRDEHVKVNCAVRSKLETMPILIKASDANDRDEMDKKTVTHPTVVLKGIYLESGQGIPGGFFTAITLDPCEVVSYKIP